MKVTRISLTALILSGSAFAMAQDPRGHDMEGHPMELSAAAHHHHGTAVAVTYEELTRTAEQLEAARRATAKYGEVREAEADGYHAIGPDVPGMGIHYVRSHSYGSNGFDVEHPDILLYEKTSSAPGGYALVGVSYLLVADTDSDGQPKNSPFPKSLASWHRHADLCVFPDRSVKSDLGDEQCKAHGGQFTALTQWMIHAWIWKDSPDGVFSPTNPNVQ
jgi:hypothetical protein